MLRDYEILYIVRPDVEETDLPDVTKRVETLIESLAGSVQNTNVWGKRRLAYEVEHMREGHYVLTDFQIEPVRVPEMEATLKISETVFRHLIVRKPVIKPGAAIATPAAAGVEAGPDSEAVSEAEPAIEPEAEATTPSAEALVAGEPETEEVE